MLRHAPVRRRIAQAVLLAFGWAQAWQAAAMPTGAEISAGSAAISSTGSQMTIRQSTSKAAINWQQFNIGPGESVQFVQPGASAIALNRVLGQDPSAILGRLSANGQVLLLNPNGVLFGPGAQVNVGGIVASTLSLSDADFLAGRYGFSGDGGSVVNQGTIEAAEGGYVVLLAPRVSNEGVISAPLGTAALAAGEQVTLTLADNKLLAIAVDRDAVGALAANKQLIRAEGGQIILTAKARDALLDTVVNNEGVIEARSVSMKNGVIRLEGGERGVVSVSGTLDASGREAGESGGRVEITGDKVAVLPRARIDASGKSRGGTVLIGGDVQGGNPGVQNADRTFVAQGAEVSADAIASGDGGKIVVWGNTSAQVYGKLTANGASEGGDGGFVETSGKHLDVDGATIEAAAPNGRGGTWLLDPYNLTIGGAATANTDNNTNTAPDWNATGNAAVVQASQIAGKLDAGTSVIITTGDGSGAQNGDLTVAASIAKTAGGDAALTLRGHDQVTLNNNVSISSTSGRLDVTLNSDSDGVNGGSILLNNGSSILSNGGNVTLGGGADPTTTAATGGATSQAYGVRLNNATIDAAGGNVIVNGQGRSTGGASNYGVWLQNAARIQTTGAGTITVSGTGGAGTNNNHGVYLQNTAQIASVTGDISITGQAQGTGTNNSGVRMDATSSVQTVDGTITVSGTGAASTTGNNGVYLRGGNAKLAATGTGSVSVTGVAGAGTNNNRGIQMDQNNTRIETGSGAVTLIGTGNGSGASNYGVYLTGTGVRATSTSGDVTVTGTGAAGTNNNFGVYVSGSGAGFASGDGNVSVTGQGAGSGTANYGVRMQNAARVEATGTGTVAVMGTGGNGTSTNYGVLLQSNDTRIATTTGSITVTGQAQGSATNNMGVRMDNTSAVETVDGTITITGTGAAGTTGNNGVYLRGGNAKLAATGTGSVSVTGTAGAGSNNNRGIQMDQNNTRIETGSGDITLAGTGNGSGASNYGAYLTGTGVRATSTSGDVTVAGAGGAGTNNNFGVYVSGSGAGFASGDGNVSVTGQGAGAGAANYGVRLQNAARVEATGTGTVSVTGTGGNGTNNNYGVYLQSNNTLISSTTGNVTVTGQAQGLGTNNIGVRMDNTSSVQSVDGSISVAGTGGDGTNGNNRNAHGVYLAGGNAKVTTTGTGTVSIQGTGGTAGTGTTRSYGVVITGGNTRVETAAGNIAITGTGAQTGGAQNYGVYLTGGNARVTSTSGDIAVNGTGGTGTTNNFGVYVTGTDARVASTSGNVTVTGTGGAGTNNNYGAYFTGTRARVESATGDVALTGQGAGTGNNNYGVRLNTSAQVTSSGAGSGTIAVTGTGAGAAPGVITTGSGTLIGAAGHSGDITISADTVTGADSIVLANTAMRGTGQLTLQPIDPASTVGVAGGAGEFNLSTTELGYIQNGFDSLIIGRANGSGAVTTGTYNNYNADTTLRGATSNISVGTTTMPAPGGNDAGTLTLATGGTVTQTGPITATNLVLLGAGGTHTLTNAGNTIGTLAASTGSVNLLNSGALTVGTVGATVGVSTTGNATVVTTPGAGHDITLANSIASTGGDVVVASGEDLNYGAATISAGGRWLTYSRSPAQNTGTVPVPGNAKPNLYNRTYAANPPATITEPGNHNIYSYQPSLTVTADNQNKIYGEPVPTLTATVTGLANGDTAADAYSGAPSLGTTATATSSVTGNPYPITVAPGTLVSDVGYTFTYVNGQLTVVARPVTIAADAGQTKLYGDPNPAAYTYTITGGPGTTGSPIVPGDTVSGALARAAGENVGAYAINQGTVAVAPAIEYIVTYVGSNFVVTPATLQYVADPVSVQTLAPLPTFTGTVTGFKGADNLGNATTGTAVFSTTVQNTFVPGVYPIWGAGLAANNGNYVFAQAPGNASAFDVGASSQGDAVGTVRAQRIRRCRDDVFAYATPVGSLPCALPPDGGDAPGPQQPLVIEGTGIRLPDGVH
ncbi:MAG: filamentous hemagglutinin N-terminal domain-containing protein [Betaproteobacteria bacterium]|nr:filamentous hemagglutinin N-terminal domain-containing protein [Betaproteobacteria bacterium]